MLLHDQAVPESFDMNTEKKISEKGIPTEGRTSAEGWGQRGVVRHKSQEESGEE